MLGKGGILAAGAGVVVGAAATAIALQSGVIGAASDAQVERIVRDYILEHPEILPEAMQRLQDRESAKVVEANRAAIETPFAGAWAGAADGDVVLVEFFDYACGYCRRSNPDVERLLAEDKKLKVVWRELPVLGPDSERAALVSLAAAKANRFKDFHDRLFAAGRPDASAIQTASRAVGVSIPPASPDFAAEVGKNMELARAIGATGTPTFVVGNRVLQGAVGYEALKDAVADARSRG